MLRHFSTITCTIVAAGLMAAVGGSLHAEKIQQVANVQAGGCTGSGCAGDCATKSPTCNSGCATPSTTCNSGCADTGCSSGGCSTGNCSNGGCNSCGSGCGGHKHSWRHASCGQGGGLFGHHGCKNYIEGLDPHFNCGCNGSYNFPVPPLSTYMWPGMYKDQLMTNYDNPKRFPPIKAYTDEAADVIPDAFRKNYPEKPRAPVIPLDEDLTQTRSGSIQPVGLRRELPTRKYAGSETMSEKMERYYSSSAQ